MPKVSIIVPVYNAGKDIANCIKSVKLQSFKDLEIIIVDDGSTDETIKVILSFEAEDSRIRLIYNKNKGVSSARNTGIEEAKGEYIVFIDADDCISPVYIETLVTMIQKYKCESAAVAYTNRFKDIVDNVEYNNIECFNDGKVFSILTNVIPDIGGYVWNKIYLAGIIRKYSIRFNENISAGEDLLFNFEYYRLINKVSVCKSKLYYYKLSEGSAINRLNNPRWFDLLNVYSIIEKSDLSSNTVNPFLYNYALLILEAIFRIKYCKDCQYTLSELRLLKKKFVKLSLRYTPKQNIKLLFFILMPNIAMKYKRRGIKE